jgi:hypothetical protein
MNFDIVVVFFNIRDVFREETSKRRLFYSDIFTALEGVPSVPYPFLC